MDAGSPALRSFGRSGSRNGLVTAAKLGYAVKGVVYLLIGALALKVSATGRGRAEGKEGAVREIGAQPLGDVWLFVVGVGLAGYALWRLVSALADTEREGNTLQGVAKRVGYAVSGLMHGAVAVASFQLAFGMSGAGHAQAAQTWIGAVLHQPWGEALLLAIGAGIVIAGLAELMKAITASFERDLDTSRMSGNERCWVRRLGRAGHAAHGVVLSIIGIALIRGALDYNPRQVAEGLGGALREIQTEPQGATLLAIVAIGLAAYGLFMLVCARYRVIRTL